MSNDKDLNRSTPDSKRRVPFSNMLYIGDGLSDVPCMKMVKAYGGCSIAVHNNNPRQLEGVSDLLYHNRVDFAFEADTHFPNLDADPAWEITASSDEQTYFDLEYTFVKYERK